jgi:hypothetical protein
LPHSHEESTQLIIGKMLGVMVLGLNVPLATRRTLLSGAGGAVAAMVTTASSPVSALDLFGVSVPDPIGAYGGGSGIGDFIGPVKKAPEGSKPNAGILLLRETFDGGVPEEGLLGWYQDHLADDFKASFAGGKIILDKAQYLAVTADLLKSFPDFTYTRVSSMKYADSPNIVTWTAVVKGTHSGAPFSPLPGVPPVAAKSPPAACENDAEKITATFVSGTGLTKIKGIKVTALPGGKGFSGPVGFYLQAGGDPSKLPAPP